MTSHIFNNNVFQDKMTHSDEESAELVDEKSDEHSTEAEAFLPNSGLPKPKPIAAFGLTPKSCFSVSINILSAVGLVSTCNDQIRLR